MAVRVITDYKVVERQGERHDESGDDTGNDPGEDNLPERLCLRAPEVHSRLVQGDVGGVQAREHVQYHVRKIEGDMRDKKGAEAEYRRIVQEPRSEKREQKHQRDAGDYIRIDKRDVRYRIDRASEFFGSHFVDAVRRYDSENGREDRGADGDEERV